VIRLPIVLFAIAVVLCSVSGQTPPVFNVPNPNFSNVVREIEASRTARHEESPALQRIHWEPFSAKRAEWTCRGTGDLAADFGEVCKDEAAKLLKALARVAISSTVPKTLQPDPDLAKDYKAFQI